jgi:nuclear pore complex protein Nup155
MYDDLGQIIITAALVKPRPGVFVEEIKFVIVLATPVEIVMLGVVFEGDNVYGELQLYPSKIAPTPTTAAPAP